MLRRKRTNGVVMANASAVRSSTSPANGPRGLTPAGLVALFYKHRSFMIPAGFIAMIMVIMVPMPTWMLDILLSANLTVAAVILVSVIFVRSPLELSVFPALLLGTTLFR